MLSRQPYTFDRVMRLLINMILAFLTLWLIYVLRGVLLPFGVACVIAYLFEPFVQFNRRLLNLRGRVIAVFVTLFEALFMFGIACYFVVPSVIEESHQVGILLKKYASSGVSVPFLPDALHQFLRDNIDFQKLSQMMSRQDVLALFDTCVQLLSGGVEMIITLFSWLLVFVYVIFIMLDYERLNRGYKVMIPPRYRPVALSIGGDIKRSMNHYFRGQSLVAFLVGVLFSIGFLIVGLPMAIVLGLFIGLLNMVPYLQLVSLPVTSMLCLIYSVDNSVDFWPVFWQCMLVYIVVQAIQDLVLTPKIMGKAMGLNPAIILLSLSVWGSLLGLLGMILALPMTTLLLSYYERYVINGKDAETVEKMIELPDE